MNCGTDKLRMKDFEYISPRFSRISWSVSYEEVSLKNSWNNRGISMEYAWNKYGWSMDAVWKFVWIMYGICMD